MLPKADSSITNVSQLIFQWIQPKRHLASMEITSGGFTIPPLELG